jgi:DNA-binding GntR family transcriptional regulator
MALDGDIGTHALTAVRSLDIGRSTTAERVAEGLRALIIQGDLRPGSPLREPVLVEALGVSRNTLREAFRLLSHERLVVHRMNRGVEVRQLTEDDVRDLYQTRQGLEATAIDRSSAASREQLRPLRDAVDQAAAALELADWKTVGTQDILFHQRLVALIGSHRIDAFFESVLAELRLAFSMASDQEALVSPYVAWNHKMCGLIERGKQAACLKEMDRYLARSEQVVRLLVGGTDVHEPNADVVQSARR